MLDNNIWCFGSFMTLPKLYSFWFKSRLFYVKIVIADSLCTFRSISIFICLFVWFSICFCHTICLPMFVTLFLSVNCSLLWPVRSCLAANKGSQWKPFRQPISGKNVFAMTLWHFLSLSAFLRGCCSIVFHLLVIELLRNKTQLISNLSLIDIKNGWFKIEIVAKFCGNVV